jgi:hypothetical protein
MGNGGTPLFRPEPKGPSGPDRFHPAGPSATEGVAHCNSGVFLLSFELFKSISKFQTLEIHRELNKFNKIIN